MYTEAVDDYKISITNIISDNKRNPCISNHPASFPLQQRLLT